VVQCSTWFMCRMISIAYTRDQGVGSLKITVYRIFLFFPDQYKLLEIHRCDDVSRHGGTAWDGIRGTKREVPAQKFLPADIRGLRQGRIHMAVPEEWSVACDTKFEMFCRSRASRFNFSFRIKSACGQIIEDRNQTVVFYFQNLQLLLSKISFPSMPSLFLERMLCTRVVETPLSM